MVYEVINSLLWRNMNVHLQGYHFSGKSAILAMHKSIEHLKPKPQFISVDGNKFKPIKDIPFKNIN